MRLSEAIRIGAQLRGESHSGPFARIANTEELRSDVSGAACEAVHSIIAKRNWNKDNQLSYGSDVEYMRQIHRQHFARYYMIPVSCPGASTRSVVQAGGRFTGRVVGGLNDFAVEREVSKELPAITSACPAITNFAEFLEHAYYVHNWSREQCAQAAEFTEQGDLRSLVQTFEHYSDLSVAQRVNRKLTAAARARERQRHQRRACFN